jgi:two-component system, chemotaxis family, protein-glutamate methylesterase/glutaminase
MKIKVLIVDDSAVIRRILTEELAKDPDLEVVGTAEDPYAARRQIVALKPDVITLDLDMPRMDGLTFLKKLKVHYPIPVVILSAFTPAGCQMALKAMELGAIEVMHKPDGDSGAKLPEVMIMLADKIKAAAQLGVSGFRGLAVEQDLKQYDFSQAVLSTQAQDTIVAIGASTGGTEALRYLIPQLPAHFPGLLVTQHMPEYFTGTFAEHLNQMSQMEVREAKDGDAVRPGLVLVAKGNNHMLLRKQADTYCVEIKDGPLVNRQKPSVDVLFDSVARCAGKNSIGVLLTGMGDDGAKGLLHLNEAGGFTIAQDKESSVVFGMPRIAIELGAAKKIVALKDIPAVLMQYLSS